MKPDIPGLAVRIPFRKRMHGWWRGPGYLKHHCTPPRMPKGVPSGVIYRCECGNEWIWEPVS